MATPGTLSPKKLGQGMWQTGLGTAYTVGTPMHTKVTSIKLSNFSTAGVAVGINFVPAGNSAGSSNSIITGLTIPADGAAYEMLQGDDAEVYMNDSDFITGTASVGSAVSYYISGVELQ